MDAAAIDHGAAGHDHQLGTSGRTDTAMIVGWGTCGALERLVSRNR
jgi:hypothetical protein